VAGGSRPAITPARAPGGGGGARHAAFPAVRVAPPDMDGFAPVRRGAAVAVQRAPTHHSHSSSHWLLIGIVFALGFYFRCAPPLTAHSPSPPMAS